MRWKRERAEEQKQQEVIIEDDDYGTREGDWEAEMVRNFYFTSYQLEKNM